MLAENLDDKESSKRLKNITQLRAKLSESVRTERKNIADVPYVELKDNIKTVSLKTNNVIFGRRGTGKTMLLGNLHRLCKDNMFYSLFVDCELIKKYTYPNIVIFILKSIFEELQSGLGVPFLIGKKATLKNAISKEIQDLSAKLQKPDFQESLKKEEEETSVSTGGVIEAKAKPLGGKVTSSLDSKSKSSKEFKQIDIKIKDLDSSLPKYQKLIDRAIKLMKKERLFILLDDFYFILQDTQFKLIDFMHKLCKGSLANFKVATIRHRSKIYERSETETIGVQGVADFRSIDLDYTLDRPELSEQFMRNILNNFIDENKIELKLEDMFVSGNNGVKRLVWASGGVPRDFLNILIFILDEMISEQNISKKIGRDRVNSASVKYYQEKLSEFDSKIFKKGDAIMLFNWIQEKCISEHKKTAFLIKKGSFGRNGLQELFNNLIDLRLIHLVRKNETIKKGGGELFEAYILDMGCYAGELRLRKKIEEIDIFERGEKTSDSPFRYRAPILDLKSFKA